MKSWCRWGLLALCWLSGWVQAANYVGYLVPNRMENPTYLSLNLTIKGNKITGNGSALLDKPTEIIITSASYTEGLCKISIEIKDFSRATLNGLCGDATLVGEYSMFIESEHENRKENGRFDLKREKGAAKAQDMDSGPLKSKGSKQDCLKKHIQCLSFCPRGDYNAEFLCVNSCRRKDAACKGKLKADPMAPNPAGAGAPGRADFENPYATPQTRPDEEKGKVGAEGAAPPR